MCIYPPVFRLRAAEPLEAYLGTLTGLSVEANKKRDALPESDNGDWSAANFVRGKE